MTLGNTSMLAKLAFCCQTFKRRSLENVQRKENIRARMGFSRLVYMQLALTSPYIIACMATVNSQYGKTQQCESPHIKLAGNLDQITLFAIYIK